MKKVYIVPTAKFISMNNESFICFSLHPEPGSGEQLSKENDMDDFEEDTGFSHKNIWDE